MLLICIQINKDRLEWPKQSGLKILMENRPIKWSQPFRLFISRFPDYSGRPSGLDNKNKRSRSESLICGPYNSAFTYWSFCLRFLLGINANDVFLYFGISAAFRVQEIEYYCVTGSKFTIYSICIKWNCLFSRVCFRVQIFFLFNCTTVISKNFRCNISIFIM